MITDSELSALLRRTVGVTRDVDAAVRPKLAAVVLRHLLDEVANSREPRGASSTPVSQPTGQTPLSSGTLAEALAGRIRSHPNRLLGIAAYRFERGVDAVTTDEFLDAYREVRAAKPQNLHANIGTCVQRGWLAEADEKDGRKAWRITQTGLKRAHELMAED